MSDPARWSLLRGVAERPQTLRELRAGTSTVCLDGGDIRYYRVEGREFIRRVYVAVRNPVWETLRATVTPWELRSRADAGYEASYSASVSEGDVAFEWTGKVELLPSGELTYSMDGQALSEFDYARIGLCVLHPPNIAGRPFRALTAEGLFEGSFPAGIGPQPLIDGEYLPLMPAFSSLAVDLGQGAGAEFEFEGDVFEIEDQRNWLDASYKSYSTPMASGILRARPGQHFFQRVHIKVTDPEAQERPRSDRKALPRLELDSSRPGGIMPAIGLGMASDSAPLTTQEGELLKGLGLDHLRVDLHLGRPTAALELARAAHVALSCESGLEIALFVEGDTHRELEVARALAEELTVPIRRFLVFGERTLVTPTELLRIARQVLSETAPVFGGTNIYFAELNRDRPDPASADGFAFSVNPQVHSSDDRSLMEAPQTFADILRSAREFLGDSQIAVGPITLLPRFNPDTPEWPTSEISPADHRQPSLMCATWTLESATYLSQERAHSVTFFETSGDRGVIARPTQATRLGGMVAGPRFPVYDVVARLCQWARKPTYTVRSTDPLAAFGIACPAEDVLQMCVGNVTEEKISLQLSGLPETACTISVLDAETVARGWTGGEAALSSNSEEVSEKPPRELRLSPYAVAFLSLGKV